MNISRVVSPIPHSRLRALAGTTILLAGLLALGAEPGAAPREPRAPVPCATAAMMPHHILTANCHMANAIAIGMARSETFRRLVERVQALNGVVYVNAKYFVQPFTNRLLEGALQHRVTEAGPYRLLFVTVAPRSGIRPIPTIAHELQHAVEVLESGATTERAIDQLFERIGVEVDPWTTETNAAILAQRAVAKELSLAR